MDPEKAAAFAGNVLAAIAIYIVGKIVVRILTGLLEKVMTRAKVDATLASFLSNISQYVLITFVILMALESLGVNTTSLAAIMGAAGLAVGFALQSSLSNFASGVMIILFKPFRVGNFVEAAGASGTVEAISIFSTLMRTGDNKQIIVPNGSIYGGNIINYSAKSTRRIDMVVGCGYGDDLRAVKAFLTILVESDERILKDPAPVVAVSELGDNSVNFVVRPWVNSVDYWIVLWDLNERVKLGFDERGFNIPYPQRDVHIHQATG
ncbi:MAG: mechanosensitive ion channel [Rhodopirellula sp.]|nr:mechanosensitive ion channel [Rhodopirellula sp.]